MTAIRQTHAELGSEDKTLLEAGHVTGLSADYGHLDLLTARAAPRELFPRIVEWLRERS
jgi:hypothetical protein